MSGLSPILENNKIKVDGDLTIVLSCSLTPEFFSVCHLEKKKCYVF